MQQDSVIKMYERKSSMELTRPFVATAKSTLPTSVSVQAAEPSSDYVATNYPFAYIPHVRLHTPNVTRLYCRKLTVIRSCAGVGQSNDYWGKRPLVFAITKRRKRLRRV